MEQSFVEKSNEEDVLTLIDEELVYVAFVLEEDAKNYHVSLKNHGTQIAVLYSTLQYTI